MQFTDIIEIINCQIPELCFSLVTWLQSLWERSWIALGLVGVYLFQGSRLGLGQAGSC